MYGKLQLRAVSSPWKHDVFFVKLCFLLSFYYVRSRTYVAPFYFTFSQHSNLTLWRTARHFQFSTDGPGWGSEALPAAPLLQLLLVAKCVAIDRICWQGIHGLKAHLDLNRSIYISWICLGLPTKSIMRTWTPNRRPSNKT